VHPTQLLKPHFAFIFCFEKKKGAEEFGVYLRCIGGVVGVVLV